jgi:UDP-glucose 4-epimerase
MVLGKIGLTGATGMLGRHLHAALAAAGAEVVAVSRTSSDDIAGWDLAKWLELEELDQLFPDVQAVVHAGALVQPSGNVDQARMFDANVRACLNLGQWALARGIPLVYISGAIVYADPCAPTQDESAEPGWSGLGGFYGFSKLLAEDVLTRLRQKGLKLSLLRPTSIYGHGLDGGKMVQRFLSIAAADGAIELSEPTEDRVDLVHAADVASVAVAVLARKCWDTLNVSSGNPVSIKALAQACVDVAGSGRISITGQTLPGYKPSVTYSLNISRAQERLGWTPAIDIHRGLGMLLREQYLAGPQPANNLI